MSGTRLWLGVIVATVLLPMAARADGMATVVCVFDPARYKAMVEKAGGLEKVSDAELMTGAVQRAYLKDTVDLQFKHAGRAFRLVVSRRDFGVLYALMEEKGEKSVTLIGAGTLREEGVKHTDEEPVIVVMRRGTFLKQ